MRTVPERSAGTQIAVVFGGFLLGPLAAHRLSLYLAPASDVVETVSVFTFIVVFVGGTVVWLGLGVLTVVLRALWSLARGRLPRPSTSTDRPRLVPPGYRAYAVLGTLLGGGLGLLAAVLTDLGILSAIAAWGGLGLAYGWCLSVAAHHGYLPFPEPE